MFHTNINFLIKFVSEIINEVVDTSGRRGWLEIGFWFKVSNKAVDFSSKTLCCAFNSALLLDSTSALNWLILSYLPVNFASDEMATSVS